MRVRGCSVQSVPARCGKRISLKDETDVIFGFVTAAAMNLDYFDKPIENGGTLTCLRSD